MDRVEVSARMHIQGYTEIVPKKHINKFKTVITLMLYVRCRFACFEGQSRI